MKAVIVGAGPAGLISALNLIQKGMSPVIFEKRSGIETTACGEACDLQSLNKIPFDSDPYICRRVKGAKLFYPGAAYSYIHKEGVVLDRASWLKGMAKEIEIRGGHIRLNSEVVAIEEDSIRLKNGERIGYDILIGADGPNSCIARHLGIKHKFVVASQYKIAYDSSNMDYLEFYLDKRFSPVGYSWIFPKDGVINVGVGDDFAHLNAFLRHKGLDGYEIIEREAGIIPVSGVQKLVQHNIALIGDSASMPNPFSLGGLAPIIYASQILVRNVNNLENYDREIRKHPIAAPVLLKARYTLLELTDKDLANIGSLLAKTRPGGVHFLSLVKIVRYPSLLPKLKRLIGMYRAMRISRDYGW